jgi:hypothetical protein
VTTLQLLDERRLSDLVAHQRNRFYYGKLMDVWHHSIEQWAPMARLALLNRLALGTGVVCGLEVTVVTTAAGTGIQVDPGLAIDGWGREIIVPQSVQLVPLALTDQCGSPPPAPAAGLPASMVVSICYQECLADYAPALVTDPSCDGNGRCEAGTIIESYCLRVLEGQAAPVSVTCTPGILDSLKKGQVHQAMCDLSLVTCPPTPNDPCVILATVASQGSTLTVEPCLPRTIVPSNWLLLDLITCLSDRIEQCCGGAPPQVAKPLKVGAARVVSTQPGRQKDPGAQVVGALAAPNIPIQVQARSLPNGIDIAFENNDLAVNSVWPGGATPSVILALGGSSLKPWSVVDLANNTVRLLPPGKPPQLSQMLPGNYTVTLKGDGPNPITSKDGVALDGEPLGLPSGEGNPGGDFIFQINIAEGPKK